MLGKLKTAYDRLPRPDGIVRSPIAKRFVRELVVVVRRQRQTPEHIQRFVENILFW
jgi:hypothetical protein